MSLPWVALELSHESVAMERLEGEVIVIDFRTGCYHSTVGSGADILWLVEHRIACDAWEEALTLAYGPLDWVSVSQDVTAFLEELLSLGLATAAEEGLRPAPAFPDDVAHREWAPPVMTGNEELADLLVIDPVHGVSGDGWPSPA